MIEVNFDPIKHEYTLIDNPNRKFISATTLIHKYAQEFQKDFWSLFKALEKVTLDTNGWNGENKVKELKRKKWYRERSEEGLKTFVASHEDQILIYATKHAIELDWKKKNEEACEKGTEFHNFKEAESIANGKTMFEVRDEFGVTSGEVNLDVIPFHMGLDLDNLAEAFYPELRLYMLDHGISGTSDCVYVLPNRWVIIEDYKTNKELKFENRYQKMKFPLEHLDDCNWNHYRLQLSLYMYMLERRGYIPKSLAIIYKEERLEFDYLRDEVEALLEHYENTKALLIEKAEQAGRDEQHLDGFKFTGLLY